MCVDEGYRTSSSMVHARGMDTDCTTAPSLAIRDSDDVSSCSKEGARLAEVELGVSSHRGTEGTGLCRRGL